MIIINPSILIRMGRCVLIIIIGHDYNYCALLQQSRSTLKYDRSPMESTFDVTSQLTSPPVQSYERDFGRVAGYVPAERRQCRNRRR